MTISFALDLTQYDHRKVVTNCNYKTQRKSARLLAQFLNFLQAKIVALLIRVAQKLSTSDAHLRLA